MTNLPALRPGHTWEDALTVWLNTKNSKRTRTEYRKVIADAMAYIGGIEHVSRAALAKYHRVLIEGMDSGSLSSSTVAMRLSAVRGFLRFCGVDDKLLAEVLDRPEVGTEHPYETVTDAELEALIAACDNPRDRAMIRLLRETGLRCEELCDAQVTDVHANDSNVPYLRVRHGKRNKMRDVPLSERAMGAVRALLEDTDRTMQSRGYLLLSRTGERLTTSRVRQVLIDARQGAGLSKEISAHSFRHTAATTWLRKGAKINDVAHLLGHSSLEATKRYVDHVELDELARIVGD